MLHLPHIVNANLLSHSAFQSNFQPNYRDVGMQALFNADTLVA